MVRSLALGAIALGAVHSPLLAQNREMTCGTSLRYRSNFRLNGGQQYLAQAERAQHPPDRQRNIASGLRVLGEAVQAGGNIDQLTLWYLYGRLYGLQGDLRGADSAFTRAATAAASDQECLREIARLRFNLAVPLLNAGVEQMRSENWDSALTLLKAGVLISPTSGIGYMNIASTYLRRDQYDSAAAYYSLAARLITDPQQEEMRANASFNAGRVYERAGRFAAAESAYRFLLTIRPRDTNARVALAGVLRRQNRTAEATALMDSLVANHEQLTSFELFEIGTGLFRDSAYARAARALLAGLAKNPWYRDAHFNLTNVYLAAGDTARMLEAARR
ncbi:MAG TPA: tetratricopeptide repeat protein, partial [Gemmatimonadales bacterium]|nr:tetratricopeptide repeat protein [Gemmatimonadales bacterium]